VPPLCANAAEFHLLAEGSGGKIQRTVSSIHTLMATPDKVTPPRFVDWRKYSTPRHIAFVEYVSSLEYRKRCAILRGQSLLHFLYKFRSCMSFDGKDTWIDRLRDVLVRSRFWLSSPASFNDPYDMTTQVILGGNAREVRKTFDDFLKERRLNWRDRQKQLERFMSGGIENLGSHAQRTFESMASAAGVYSFGGNPLNLLMWSHYGENHRGICFQFDVAQDVENFTAALPVEYSEEYPILNWVGINNGSQDVTTVLLRKFKGWAYEEEHRIIKPESAGTYLAFDPAALTAIILGCRAPDPSVERIKELLVERSAAGLPSPKIYRAFRHASKYRLILKRE
jgi:hypothetical protein